MCVSSTIVYVYLCIYLVGLEDERTIEPAVDKAREEDLCLFLPAILGTGVTPKANRKGENEKLTL